ncbi:MAG: zinc-dependent alcohol dehydrogenase family protein [Gammaproteobacteria bacterium]|nr:zinc-dependent alcohol dehydrogenase family protein [Gammaproteobacteria bacterium]
MQAQRAHGPGQALRWETVPVPRPGAAQVLVEVSACGVCRTDLHLVDGELPQARYPVIPGHEIVGTVVARGADGGELVPGMRVGIPWLGHTCGTCFYCEQGRENLCDAAAFTGCSRDGGYAEYCVADARYCFPLPAGFDDVAVAPLLCAGLIGYRSLRMAGDARRLGVFGFGAAAHLIAQVARWQGREVYAFTRAGDMAAQDFARRLGAVWAGGSDERPPVMLDAALLFAPVGALVPTALALLRKGGRVVCGGIHMSDIPSFAYERLWGEREIVSVANLTRQDAVEFLDLAARVPVATSTQTYVLAEANLALDDLRQGRLQGAAVLICRPSAPMAQQLGAQP